MIRKLSSGKYRLYSRKADPRTGKRRNLGTFGTRAAAEKHAARGPVFQTPLRALSFVGWDTHHACNRGTAQRATRGIIRTALMSAVTGPNAAAKTSANPRKQVVRFEVGFLGP